MNKFKLILWKTLWQYHNRLHIFSRKLDLGIAFSSCRNLSEDLIRVSKDRKALPVESRMESSADVYSSLTALAKPSRTPPVKKPWLLPGTPLLHSRDLLLFPVVVKSNGRIWFPILIHCREREWKRYRDGNGESGQIGKYGQRNESHMPTARSALPPYTHVAPTLPFSTPAWLPQATSPHLSHRTLGGAVLCRAITAPCTLHSTPRLVIVKAEQAGSGHCSHTAWVSVSALPLTEWRWAR